jgi:hypothetical protein
MIRLILVSILCLAAFIPSGVYATDNITTNLTTYVYQSSSGGFDVGGGGSSLTWEDVFPQLRQQPQSSSPYIPPQQTYIPLPETTHSTVLQGSTQIAQDASESSEPLNGAIVAAIVFGSIAIGLIVWGIYTLVNRRRNENER